MATKLQAISKKNFKFISANKSSDGIAFVNYLGEIININETACKLLVQHLELALEQNMNVIVHCHAGICRSGAVAEVGIMMGFEDTKTHRIPNLLVKFNMMKFLGWVYE